MDEKSRFSINHKWTILAILFVSILSALYSVKMTLIFLAFKGLILVLNFLGVFESAKSSRFVKRLLVKNELYWLTRNSKNITHSLLLVGKYMLGVPSVKGEDEITAYSDLKNSLGAKWPFMMPVSKTGQEVMSVMNKPARCFSSYSYLNLNRDERVQEAAIKSARLYSSGNVGPRMLCGNLEILEELEVKISKFLRKESTLVFSAGFLACMSAICGFARKEDLLLMDKLCHASLKTGSKLSGSTVVYFNHNDFKDAENKIKKHRNKRLIMIIEGVYSMDGDIGNLPEARRLCDAYNGILILDEAHSLGSIGKTGRGTEELHDYKYLADIVCGSFTKSLASVGGYISTSKRLRDFYALYAPGVLFSAPLSAYHAGAVMKALEIIETEPQMVTRLQQNGDYLRKKFKENGFNIGHTTSVVIPVIFEELEMCFRIHHYLLSKGCYTACVMAPACPVNAPRFRITCTSSLTKEDLDFLVDLFVEAREKCPMSAKFKELKELM